MANEPKDWGLTFHRFMQYVVTGLMCFSSFILHDMWNSWKDHLKEDRQTELIVTRHDSEIKQNTVSLSTLTGRVDAISEHYVSK